MKKLTLILLVSVLVLICTQWAQDLKFPRVSQGAKVLQTIGLTEVEITYHRPGVKGRVIWGGLVPYDKIWRAGANEATTIKFSQDVMIEGKKLAAGTYGLFTVPGKAGWSFVFSKQADIWGTYNYKKDQDVLRVKVKHMAAPHCEWMRFGFTKLTDDSAWVYLHWEKLMVGFTVKVETESMVFKGIEKEMTGAYRSAYYAAGYAYDKGVYDKAKNWIKISLAAKQTYWNMLLKAKIYKKLAKTRKENKKAIEILKDANMLIKDLPENQKQYATEGPKLLKEWKGKKK